MIAHRGRLDSGASTEAVNARENAGLTSEASQNRASTTSNDNRTVSVTAGRVVMPARMPYQPVPGKKATLQSACIRLADLYGDSPATWENRMNGAASDYQQVARMNRVLRELGLEDKVCERMTPVEDSMAALTCDPATARYREAKTDATEDELQAEAEADPKNPEKVRALVRYRSVMWQATLDDSRRRCKEVGLVL